VGRIISPSLASSRLSRRHGQRIGFAPNSPFVFSGGAPAFNPGNLPGQIVVDNDSPTVGDTITLTWIDWGVYGSITATPDSLTVGDSTLLEFVPVTLTYQWISGVDGSNLSGETAVSTEVEITDENQVLPKLRVTNPVSGQSKVFNPPTVTISPAAFSDNFNRGNTSPGSGANSSTAIGNGWLDRVGNLWSINSNRAQTTGSALPLDQCMYQSGYTIQDGAARVERVSGTIGLVARFDPADGSGYAGLYYPPYFIFYKRVVGGPGQAQLGPLETIGTISTPNGAIIRLSAFDSGGSTVLRMRLFDAGAPDVPLANRSVIDSSSPLQRAGHWGIGNYDAGSADNFVLTSEVAESAVKNIAFLGDSITDGYGGSPRAADVAISALNTAGQPSVSSVAGYGGQQSGNLLPGGALYISTVAQFVAAEVTTVSIMLGTNDAIASVSKATYKANMLAIANGLIADGFAKVVLNEPIWMSGYETLLLSYQEALDEIVNGTTIVRGDTLAYAAFEANPGWLVDGIHPNTTGHAQLGNFWSTHL
jgi:lysophospholipase L1-like esterase